MRTLIVMMMLLETGEGKCRIHHLGVRNYLRSDTIVSATVMSFYMKETGGASGGKEGLDILQEIRNFVQPEKSKTSKFLIF